MTKSEIEELPEELRKILLRYISPLNKSLLHSKDEDEFERDLKNVTLELLRYSGSVIFALTEEHLALLLKNYWRFSSGAVGVKPVPTLLTGSLKQAVTEASEIIANFIRLTVELNYRDFVKEHTDVFALYIELLVYTAILVYMCDHPQIEVEPSMTKKIIRNTQETWKVMLTQSRLMPTLKKVQY
jgi:hypothetical protein